jgi:hypothetical protein
MYLSLAAYLRHGRWTKGCANKCLLEESLVAGMYFTAAQNYSDHMNNAITFRLRSPLNDRKSVLADPNWIMFICTFK